MSKHFPNDFVVTANRQRRAPPRRRIRHDTRGSARFICRECKSPGANGSARLIRRQTLADGITNVEVIAWSTKSALSAATGERRGTKRQGQTIRIPGSSARRKRRRAARACSAGFSRSEWVRWSANRIRRGGAAKRHRAGPIWTVRRRKVAARRAQGSTRSRTSPHGRRSEGGAAEQRRANVCGPAVR